MPDATCSVDGCNQSRYCRGWCRLHYFRWWRHGDPLAYHRKPGTCSVDGCEKRPRGKGLCGMHLGRFIRNGDPLIVTRISGDPEANFWLKVQKTPTCWLWTGHINDSGYGDMRINGRLVRAHRFAYELLVGPIPDGLVLDHVYARGCRNRNCVNPAHLEPVTLAENTRRGREAPT